MGTWGRRIVAAGLAAALALTLAGCGSSARLGIDRCLPAPLEVTPPGPDAGTTVTVSSPAAECDLGYSAGHTYSVTLVAEGVPGTPGTRTSPVEVEVAADGSFSVPLAIPDDFPRGDASVVVSGSPYDECGKDGTGSCAGYTAAVHVR
ncbi:hypothetical protein [Leifsonia aquatica]|uniref:Uncharacterized protein n=2 Tax=Leifsonia aquatica TaxID=144185 RepID=U2T9N3_LEIAQ|nr:hypothetical protein [Leifsonia aquatica]ERK71402.1 hypothetical protein N136_02241 [Leifsonia aquatica ATCC 14665]MBB2968087.1 hypothetical protein [Leifsonia aquatica]